MAEVSERQYILISDLTRVRMLHEVIGGMLPMSSINQKEYDLVRRLISKWQTELFNSVGHEMHPEENDDEEWTTADDEIGQIIASLSH